ncbi:hypothetical protein [Streptomyces sp. NPDC088812]|uniref:hypothetical protein n=1 Tax=Streptomyces sp. NPDC088812 TaxID=3365905 RepID=UPI003829305D
MTFFAAQVTEGTGDQGGEVVVEVCDVRLPAASPQFQGEARGAVDALRGLGWQIDDALLDGDPSTPVPILQAKSSAQAVRTRGGAMAPPRPDLAHFRPRPRRSNGGEVSGVLSSSRRPTEAPEPADAASSTTARTTRSP